MQNMTGLGRVAREQLMIGRALHSSKAKILSTPKLPMLLNGGIFYCGLISLGRKVEVLIEQNYEVELSCGLKMKRPCKGLNMPSVTTVIISYHTGPILFESIASVLRQKSVSQVLLIDNGNPPQVVSELEAKFGGDSRFRLLSGHGNIGFAKACNLGAAYAEGEFLLFLNPDCIIPGLALKGLIQIGMKTKGKWLLAPHLVNLDGSHQKGGRREILTPWIAFVEGLKLYKVFPRHPYFKRFDLHETPLPEKIKAIPVTSGACMFIKRSIYTSFGGMDESYFLHVEDVDFCMRFRKFGGKIYFCPQVTFVHALGTSDAGRIFIEWHKLNGFRRYFKTHFTGMYPTGFIAFVNSLLALRFSLILVREITKMPFRLFHFKGKKKKDDLPQC